MIDADDFKPESGQTYIVAETHEKATDRAHKIVKERGEQLSWFHLAPGDAEQIAAARAAGATVIGA